MSENQSVKVAENLKIQNGEITNTANDVEKGVKNHEKAKVFVKRSAVSTFRGPIPPPEVIEQYEKIVPGAADRILSMAEHQSAHRRKLEEKIVETEARDSMLGIIGAFILGVSCIAAVVICCVFSKQTLGVVTGLVFGATGITAIIKIFLVNTRNAKDKE